MGASGRAILEAMIGGEDDPTVLAGLAKGSLRGQRRELAEVVPGLVRDHHRFLLRRHLDMIDELDRQIVWIEARIFAETTGPFGAALALLESTPGVARQSAEAILAEIGDEMSKFPTAAHLAPWARVCPGNHESAGKRKSASTGKGNGWLRDALSQVAWAAARTKGGYYRVLYCRMKVRGGSKKAIVAVQHAILVAIWHMFTTGSTHEDLGPDHCKRHDKERRVRYLKAQMEKMGVKVQINDEAAGAPRLAYPTPFECSDGKDSPATFDLMRHPRTSVPPPSFTEKVQFRQPAATGPRSLGLPSLNPQP